MRGRQVVSSYHHILAKGVPEDLVPEVIVAVGAVGPSARVDGLVSSGSSRVRVDFWGRVIDPGRDATAILGGDVCDLLADVPGSASEEWHRAWIDADSSHLSTIENQVRESHDITGAGVAVALNQIEWGSLVVASSLPIRDVDAFLTRAGPVFANRGASGIDGFVSTALGVAGRLPRTLALTGDLSLLHDSNGFLNDADIDLVLIVVDNGGGGLFDQLPQERHAPDYERLFVTDQRRDFGNLARLHDLRYDEATNLEDLRRRADEALNRRGIDLIRVPVDRARDAAFRAQLDG
jgi:2-succinyl-5-enolpyruvyl-6-hydroxy-3-cyclohexene-1-carboxylate synthase